MRAKVFARHSCQGLSIHQKVLMLLPTKDIAHDHVVLVDCKLGLVATELHTFRALSCHAMTVCIEV